MSHNYKNKFIKSIQAVDARSEDAFEDLYECIDNLPNIYAKGYLKAKADSHNQEDMEELKEDLLIWSDYKIWYTYNG